MDVPETEKPTFRPPSSVTFTPDTNHITSPSRPAAASSRGFARSTDISGGLQEEKLSQAWAQESFTAPTVTASTRIVRKSGPELRPST